MYRQPSANPASNNLNPDTSELTTESATDDSSWSTKKPESYLRRCLLTMVAVEPSSPTKTAQPSPPATAAPTPSTSSSSSQSATTSSPESKPSTSECPTT